MISEMSHLLLSQAHSDLCASVRVLVPADASTYCQAIAKYQQAVEKSIKALGAALDSSGLMKMEIAHYYRHDVTKMVGAISTRTMSGTNPSLHAIRSTLNSQTINMITKLCALAPSRSKQEVLGARNTEYPFQTSCGEWTCPAKPGSFSFNEVKNFRKFSQSLFDRCSRHISALRRAP